MRLWQAKHARRKGRGEVWEVEQEGEEEQEEEEAEEEEGAEAEPTDEEKGR